MKKAGLFAICALLILLLAFAVSAQDTAPGLNDAPLVNEIQQGQQQIEQFTTEENKTQYLKTEWNKILVKQPYIGPIINAIDKVFVFLSPFFKIVLGYGYSFSWAFVFAIMIWLILFFFINPITSQLFNNGLFGGVAAFAIASLVGLSGVIKKAVDLLSFAVNNLWIAGVCMLIAVILVFLSERLGKNVKAKIKKSKEQAEEEKTAQARKVIQTEGETAKEQLEAFEKK